MPGTIDLNVTPGSEASPVLRVYGDDGGDSLGSDLSKGVAYGDVNGDGFDDVILGANLGDPAGGSTAGEVYVVYGSTALPGSTVDLNSTIGSNGETRILGDDADDRAGYSVASGDVNGDGFDDVISGATEGDPAGGTSAGEVYVVYGSASLPGSTVDLNSTIGGNGETRVLGDDAFDRTGGAVASGDVNGDGFDDMILGANQGDPAGGSTAGEVYVVYGSTALPGSTVDLNSTIGSNGETRILGDDGNDKAGFSVASGDVNGDGFDDVLIGAFQGAPAGGTDAGEVYVVYGSASLPGITVNLNSTIGSNGETRILGDDAGDQAGFSVASGDVNGDGFDDVIIGAHWGDPAGGTNAGEVYVVYGSASLPGTTADLNSTIGSNGETRILGEETGDRAGFSVASGDVNGDGFDDVILGAYGGDPAGGANAGEVFVLYGSAALPGSSVDLNSVSGDVRILGDNASDSFGFGGEAGGDVNRDSFAECAASGQNSDNPTIGGDNNSGCVVNIFGGGIATEATAIEGYAAGNTGVRGLGGRLSPVLRAQLGFTGGTAGTVTATLTRSNSAIAGIGAPAQLADMVWQLSTTRTDYTSAAITLQYLDSEIAGLIEGDLALWQSTSPTGPWTEVTGATFDTAKNEVNASVSSLGYFAVSAGDFLNPTELPVAAWPAALILAVLGAVLTRRKRRKA
ncbi:MAG: FG-GAP repeat protein [Candidatus Hydrogenedentes bacterium]|nr:FG-GAP repeat protein [Candidatus Hydrogenedentota bacterium]